MEYQKVYDALVESQKLCAQLQQDSLKEINQVLDRERQRSAQVERISLVLRTMADELALIETLNDLRYSRASEPSSN